MKAPTDALSRSSGARRGRTTESAPCGRIDSDEYLAEEEELLAKTDHHGRSLPLRREGEPLENVDHVGNAVNGNVQFPFVLSPLSELVAEARDRIQNGR